jgi:hypothetical protein
LRRAAERIKKSAVLAYWSFWLFWLLRLLVVGCWLPPPPALRPAPWRVVVVACCVRVLRHVRCAMCDVRWKIVGWAVLSWFVFSASVLCVCPDRAPSQ